MSSVRRFRQRNVVAVLGLVAAFLFFMFPVYWLLTTSLKTEDQIFSVPPPLLFVPTLSGYVELFGSSVFLHNLLNSLLVALTSSIIAMTLSAMCGYGISRLRSRLGKVILIGLLTVRMVPYVIFIVPIYLIFSNLRLLDTYPSLILSYQLFVLPFTIWMCWTYFSSIPDEVVDAARVDGSSPISTLLYIFIPLSIPMLGIAFIFSFIFFWNEFIFALVLTGRSTRTAPIFIASLVGDRRIAWGAIAAGGMVLALPTIVMTFLLAKHFVTGLTAGALKG